MKDKLADRTKCPTCTTPNKLEANEKAIEYYLSYQEIMPFLHTSLLFKEKNITNKFIHNQKCT